MHSTTNYVLTHPSHLSSVSIRATTETLQFSPEPSYPASTPVTMASSSSSPPPSSSLLSPTTTTYRVEAMKDDYLEGALLVANDFLGSGYRKRLCGIIPLAWLPMTLTEFQQSFATEDAKSASAVAIRSSDQKIVGFVHMTDGSATSTTMWRDSISKRLHPSVPGECYIEMLCVLSEAQGQGIGSKLLQFAEDRARERHAHSLALGVVTNNPAIRLYQRFGFVVDDDHHQGCGSQCNLFTTLFCIMGCPHGRCGGISMVKDLQSSK
jgi:ribosomal protein S18 acetylase RimI-like enzyme